MKEWENTLLPEWSRRGSWSKNPRMSSSCSFWEVCTCERPCTKSAEIEWLLYCLLPHRLMQIENPFYNPIATVGSISLGSTLLLHRPLALDDLKILPSVPSSKQTCRPPRATGGGMGRHKIQMDFFKFICNSFCLM